MKKNMTIIAALAVAAFALAACGADKSGTSPASGVQNTGVAAADEVDIKASNWTYDQPVYHVKKGVATKLTLTSESGVHGVAIDELNVKLESGGSQVITVNDAGTYEIHCNVICGTGHADMKAKLVVE
ncbi:cupredoxin domain-containing protein [Paenibacillus humicola]|uniref:cupredoxin domain-containing protein n=1 Tax=Paenibacillus humicola TaxID=3110540 RepID=UPI00237AA6E0|nr:cupredoxin domain-containing protein [Paenibacillus humicola]